jgi:hypothetical protein
MACAFLRVKFCFVKCTVVTGGVGGGASQHECSNCQLQSFANRCLQAVYDQLRSTKNALRKLLGKRVSSARSRRQPGQALNAHSQPPAAVPCPEQRCGVAATPMQHHTAEDLRHYQALLEKIDGERKVRWPALAGKHRQHPSSCGGMHRRGSSKAMRTCL